MTGVQTCALPIWLYRMIDEGYDYIGISPDNGKHLAHKKDWLDKVFAEITDDSGKPIIKTHGFAVTAVDFLYDYPFYSCDSMSWVIVAAFGGVFVPKFDTNINDFDYRKPPYLVPISSKSTMREVGNHFLHYGNSTKEHIVAFIEKESFTLEQVMDDFYYRSIINCRVLRRIESRLTNVRFQKREYDLLGSGVSRYYSMLGLKFPRTKLIFAINSSAPYSALLTIEGIRKRLYSYFLFREAQLDFLPRYVQNGEISDRGNKRREHGWR